MRRLLALAPVAALLVACQATAPSDEAAPDATEATASNDAQAGTQPEKRRERPQRPRQRTYRVNHVVDGDTLDLANGQRVRLVGIDTPEAGDCGYSQASAALTRLVLGERVTLAESDEDADQYGRLLRYVDVGGVDAGLTLIRRGLAIARYDSRDGYGFHPRERRYIRADRSSARGPCRQIRGLLEPPPSGRGRCSPGYDPCVPPYPPDVDCAHVSGPIRVTGPDPHGLDAEGDGWACE